MATVDERIIQLEIRINGANTVKDLKEVISELAPEMNAAEKSAEEYKQAVDLMVVAQEKLTNAMKVGKSQISAQEGSYNALVNKMAALKKVHKAVTDDVTRNSLSEEIEKINTQLKEMDAKNGVYVRNVGNYENAIKSALKTPQQELKALRVQLAQLTKGTVEYNAVFTRMAQLTHDVTEQQEMLKWSSADLGDILTNVAGVATSLAGGFSAFNALSGLFGGESEELEKAMLQAQRFIQLIQGLEQLEQLADKIKGLWQGIKNFTNTTTVGTAALIDFKQETEKAEAASTGAASAINANAKATNAGAEATNRIAEATDKYSVSISGLTEKQKNMLLLLETQLRATELEIQQYEAAASATGNMDNHINEQLESRKKSLKIIQTQINSIKQEVLTTQASTQATQANTAATNAQSAANVTAATTTTLWSKALGILKTALISTGIGVIIVALGALLNLLGKGLSALWGWISGANKAAEQTEALKSAFDALNETLEVQEKAWERQEMLMEAQGESYEEIYEARKKNLQAQLAETQVLLANQRAIANDIGKRKLQKKKYDEFRETLDELVEKEKELKQTIDDLDYKNYIDDIKAKKKADEEAAAAAKKAAQDIANAKKKEKEEADKLYNSLIEHYKTEKQKLTEKYEAEKKLLESHGKDTSLLTKKYEEDITNIELKEAERRQQIKQSISNEEVALIESKIEAIKKEAEWETIHSQILYDLYASENNVYTDFTNNYITQMQLRWQIEDNIHQLRLSSLEEEKQAYIDASKNTMLTEEERLEALAKAKDIERQIVIENADYTIAQNQRKIEATDNYVATVQDSLNAIGDILNNVADAWETSIQAQVDAGKISEEEGEKQMENMRGIQSAIAMINALSSAVSAYNSMASIPFLGPALGASAAAAALASGIAQVVAINKVKKGENGGSSNNYAQVIPTMPEYKPQVVTNITGEQETQNLANAMSNNLIKAYVVESDITSTQQRVANRNKESTF